MDFSTIIGIISAFSLVALAMSMGSGISLFIDIRSFLIVVGGTFGATMINFPLKNIVDTLHVLKKAFLDGEESTQDVSEKFFSLSNKARREGILSLEFDIEEVEDPFFKKGLQLSVDGIEQDMIKNILLTDLDSLKERHELGAEIYSTMGAFAPALGMMGTLIGLVIMLHNMNDPDSIGPGMAVALLTTFYGSVLANFVFLPIAGKLNVLNRNEVREKEMIIEGVMSLTAGDNPRILEQRLLAFRRPKKQKRIDFDAI